MLLPRKPCPCFFLGTHHLVATSAAHRKMAPNVLVMIDQMQFVQLRLYEHAADLGEDVRFTNSSIPDQPEAIVTIIAPSVAVEFFLLRRYNTPTHGLADVMINRSTTRQ